MAKVGYLTVAILLGSLAFAQEKPKPKSTPAKAKPDEKKPTELQQIIAKVLQNHPDIPVYEAKVREAQAELNRVRSQAVQQATILHAQIQAKREQLRAIQVSLDWQRRLQEQGHVSEQELIREQARYQHAKAELSQLDTELKAMQGEIPGVSKPDPTQTAIDRALLWLGQGHTVCPGLVHGGATVQNCMVCHQVNMSGANSGAASSNTDFALRALVAQQPRKADSMTQRILKVMDTPVKVSRELVDLPVSEVLHFIHESSEAENIPFRLLMPDLEDTPISVSEGELPLGAWLLLIEDIMPEGKLTIYIRPYGLLFTSSKIPPEGAVRLRDVWPPRETEKTEKPKTEE